jgi:YgiT-type zinc finger domain-containing protein
MQGGKESESWWHALKQECPITLESLSTLPYPPFSLKSGESESYFDGLALASYIVSRGFFQNPLTRQDLTMEDCRRLDEYLDSYCYKYQRQSRKVSVAEAFALRSSVHVQQQRDNASQNEARVQVLRNTATAALAGLFVYGNDRPSSRESGREDSVRNSQPQISQEEKMLLDWGFDLTKEFHESSDYATEGWTVIDDDEALVVATQREAYQTTQASFPHLNGISTDATPTTVLSTDKYIIEKVRSIAIQEGEGETLRAQREEINRQRLLREALLRREERNEKQEILRAENSEQYQKQKKIEEETQRARAEIEAWREDQWEKLRKLSRAKQDQEKEKVEINTKRINQCRSNHEEVQSESTNQSEGESLARKKAKAAAKRKRAKARKQGKKAEERALVEQKKKGEILAAIKKASALQCGACGEGILDSGFDKFEKKFCSTKCARSAEM